MGVAVGITGKGLGMCGRRACRTERTAMKNEKKKKTQKTGLLKSFRTQKQIWMICLVALVWVIIFCYIPMLGNVIAFFDYVPGKSLLDCEFIGLKHWKDFLLFRICGECFGTHW